MKTLAEIYARVPAIACKRKCHGACGPVGASQLETAVLLGLGFDVDAASRAFMRRPDLGVPSCPALRGTDCRIYPARPLICRLWGVVQSMRCPHGCRPERWLSDDEARHLLDAADRLGL